MGTPVRSIDPLRDLPLEELNIDRTQVTDLKPLAGMNTLRRLMVPQRADSFEPIRSLPLERISFWWDFDNNHPQHDSRRVLADESRGLPQSHGRAEG